MKIEGYLKGEFHELRKGISKSGNEYRMLSFRVPEDFEKHDLFLTNDVEVPGDLKPGDVVNVSLRVESWAGKSAIRIKSIVKDSKKF